MDNETKIAELEAQLAAITEERDAAVTRLNEVETKEQLRGVVREAGVRGPAVEDALNRGMEVFRLKDGALVDTENYQTPHSWIAGLRLEAPHLFGGKDDGGEDGGEDGGAAPRKKKSEMTSAEKAEFIGKYGGEKYLELPA